MFEEDRAEGKKTLGSGGRVLAGTGGTVWDGTVATEAAESPTPSLFSTLWRKYKQGFLNLPDLRFTMYLY